MKNCMWNGWAGDGEDSASVIMCESVAIVVEYGGDDCSSLQRSTACARPSSTLSERMYCVFGR